MAQKNPSKAYLVPYLRILYLHETLYFDKAENADFKYDNSFSKVLPKNTQIRYF